MSFVKKKRTELPKFPLNPCILYLNPCILVSIYFPCHPNLASQHLLAITGHMMPLVLVPATDLGAVEANVEYWSSLIGQRWVKKKKKGHHDCISPTKTILLQFMWTCSSDQNLKAVQTHPDNAIKSQTNHSCMHILN